MTFSKDQLDQMARSVPFWFHSIDLGQGVCTHGWKTRAMLTEELEKLHFPDLSGKSVLDINAWDGFYSFEAERRNAARVVALDQYMWSMELGEHHKYWKECQERGVTPAPYHTMPYYKPDELPGKAGFDIAHKALQSGVEVVVDDFMDMDLSRLGEFDVTFYFGTLYHMENPLLSLRRLAAVTSELAIIETEAAEFEGHGDRALCEFFESNELSGDVSNWWAPNERALTGMCRAAGFKHVEVVNGAPSRPPPSAPSKPLMAKLRSAAGNTLREFAIIENPAPVEVVRYRAVVHAWK